jgi:hypothetical protein
VCGGERGLTAQLMSAGSELARALQWPTPTWPSVWRREARRSRPPMAAVRVGAREDDKVASGLEALQAANMLMSGTTVSRTTPTPLRGAEQRRGEEGAATSIADLHRPNRPGSRDEAGSSTDAAAPAARRGAAPSMGKRRESHDA